MSGNNSNDLAQGLKQRHVTMLSIAGVINVILNYLLKLGKHYSICLILHLVEPTLVQM